METGGIPFQIIEQNREELWDSWQRNVGNYKGVEKLETFTREHILQVWDLDRSQELGILYEGTEVESQTSPIGTLPVEIWLHSKVCFRDKNGEGG